jgi:undecaprenyl diphosphate synthase
VSLPEHVAIIMDGNGRWAERRGLSRLEGHRRGADSVRTITRAARALGIKRLTLYAFSEQNWGRPVLEVNGLMHLLKDYLLSEREEILTNGIRLEAIGRLERLPDMVRETLDELRAASAHNTDMVLCLALSYGAREEMTSAVQRIAERVRRGDLNPDQIDEHVLASELDTVDADLIIRTSGEQRLSNFLLWQSAYAEFYFTDALWPDFGKAELQEALAVYARRNRRFGLVA